MKTIEVEDNIFEALEARAIGFGASPSTVIEGLLNIARIEITKKNDPSEQENEHHPLLQLIAAPEYRTSNGKEKYFAVLRYLYKNHKSNLDRLLSYRRGTRINFAVDPRAIEESGKDTKPQRLEGTPLYVMTNLNHPDKRAILQDILPLYPFPMSVIRAVIQSIPDSNISRPKRVDISGLL